MKIKYLFRLPLIFSLTFGVLGFLHAETPFVDPDIPNGETITYTSRTDDKLMTITESVMLKRDGDREIYEITSRSESLDRTIRLAKGTLAILSVHTVRKYPDATLDSKLTVIDEKPHSSKDEIILADFSLQKYILRGFPFEKLKKLKIGFYGDKSKKKFPFNVNYKGKEKLTVNQKIVECYKLETGMDGFWGTFVPKTEMWYSVESPHHLVRYEGPSGPPGTPRRIIEQATYTVTQ